MRYEELPDPIEIGHAENLIGQKFGELSVLYRVPSTTSDKSALWACHCSCGDYSLVRSDQLKSGKSKTCGQRKHDNLVGQKFNQLIVAERLPEYDPKKSWKYICYCDCGNTTPVITWGHSLKHNTKVRCEKCSSRTIDLTNKTFGMLKVIGLSEDQTCKYGVTWDCVCRCGRTKKIISGRLLSGDVLSCGKHHMSKGEITIMEILDDAKEKYVHNKEFVACKFPDTNRAGLFDFFFKDKKFLLEFDGKQHFEKGGASWNTEQNFVKLHNHDLYKNQWAWDNNIPMKRIPYTDLEKMTYKKFCSDEYLITPQTHPWWYPPPNSSYPYFNIDNIKEVL